MQRRSLPFLVSRGGIALALGLTFLTALLFAIRPELDLRVAEALYRGNGRFVAVTPLGDAARQIFLTVPFIVLIVFGLLRFGRRAGRLGWGPSGRALVMMVASLALGPGLLVNVALKDHWHRPRPVQVIEFGGADPFRPYDRLDGLCVRNCSFVSGEGASAFWTVAPALLLPPPWRAVAVGGALCFAAAAGALRMAFGGHFLSDTIFAALFTWLVVAACWRVILGGSDHPSRDGTTRQDLPVRKASMEN